MHPSGSPNNHPPPTLHLIRQPFSFLQPHRTGQRTEIAVSELRGELLPSAPPRPPAGPRRWLHRRDENSTRKEKAPNPWLPVAVLNIPPREAWREARTAETVV